MRSILTLFILTLLSIPVYSQQEFIERFVSDSSLLNGSASIIFLNAASGEKVAGYYENRSLSTASVMKLVTSAAALEILGPEYRFKTVIGYRGEIKSGVLNGDIIIKGGGDPALGSPRFSEHYGRLFDSWAEEIRSAGIKKIKGSIIADDSYYDYQPVPAGWNWEDMGNYYGAGVYGISISDNTVILHFRTGETGTVPVLTSAEPPGSGTVYENRLTAAGKTDNGYVYAAPYTNRGWISGQIPVNKEDFGLKASITDPPWFTAKMLRDTLILKEIKVKGEASSSRVMIEKSINGITEVTTTFSPPLSEIIKVLNHESVNLYAESLLKELGRVHRGLGSADSGKVVLRSFLDSLGAGTRGMFIEDGSGLSPQNAMNSLGLASVLYLMKKKGKYFSEYYSSLPEAGRSGTLKNVFRAPAFEGAMRAKSGTIMRVKSFAGYITTKSGNEMIFCIIVNNFTGSSAKLTSRIEDLLMDVILYK